MNQIVQQATKEFLKSNLPEIKVGDIVKVYQKIPAIASDKDSKGKSASKRKNEETRIQVFEGIVLAMKHGKGINGTFTVRKIIDGIGVEKIYPLHSPNIEKIEIVSRSKVRRAKLYYLRDRVGKKAKLKRKAYVPGDEIISETEKPKAKPVSGVETKESVEE